MESLQPFLKNLKKNKFYQIPDKFNLGVQLPKCLRQMVAMASGWMKTWRFMLRAAYMQLGMFTTFPQCNFSFELPEILRQNLIR